MKTPLLTAAAAAIVCTAPAFAAETFTIKDIRVEGLERVEPDTVFAYMPVKIGDTFTDTVGEQIIKNLYGTGFFDDIQVEAQNDVVLLTITERPVISQLEVTGGKVLSNTDIHKNLSAMGLAQSRVYNPVIMAQAIEGLKREYLNRGKVNAKIEPKITQLERNRVGVELAIEEGDTTVIREIDFVGNEHYSDRTLRNQMALSEKGMLTWLSKSDRFSPDKLSDDLQRVSEFYQDRGYLNFAVVDSDAKPNEKHPNDLDVSIVVNEGERFRWGEVTVGGDSREIPLEELQKIAKVKTGRWYNRSELNTILEKIRNRMGDSGYAFTEIAVQPKPNGDTVDFDLTIDPKQKVYVREIRISGNNKTRDEVVRRELRQMESAPYDYSKIQRSQERIQQLGYFDDVKMSQTTVADAPDQVDLDVVVSEQPTGSINVSAGYVQDDGIVLSGGFAQDNLFGSGKSVSARVSNATSSKTASLSFTDPYFTPDGVSLGYDAFWRVYDPYKAEISAYKTETYGAGVRLGVPITEYDRLNFGLGANNMKVTLYPESPRRYVDFVDKYGKSNWTITGNIGWGRNTTDSAFWPTRGYITNVNLEGGLPGGDIQYYKLTHSQSWFFPLSRSLTLMLGGGVGYADGYGKNDELPFFHNFYGGGLGSVRGYQSGSIGPKSYDYNGNVDYFGGTKQANMNAELLFPMPGMKNNRTVRLSLFADAGSVWDGKRYTQYDYQPYGVNGHHSTFKNELRYSGGLAFTWISPLGPMKFSYAVPIGKKEGDEVQRFQFQLGTVF
ncbi:MAG: outer membrane protein assembly factor BamA [Neisseriaceae bacterium]|nr:outer membrane protein assembly factor BamA [Neisseriaceae bacterium]